MQRYLVLTALAAALAPAGGSLPAQEPDEPDREPLELRLDRGPDRLMHIVMHRRARLGVKVNLQARQTDSIGAYVDAVTPGGPAARAGIRSGDVITKVDGKSVLAGGAAEGKDARVSLPGLRLIELAARLEPNDTVAVELRRGKERQTVPVVTAGEREIRAAGRPGRPFAFRWAPGPGRPVLGEDVVEDLEGDFPHLPSRRLLLGPPLADLELAPLNSDLGRYFGTSEGILVISAPKEGGLGLRGGDVVLAVDGRRPASPPHLLRILRSYEQGEAFKMEILRNRKRETITGHLGERES
jgi:membrane-associated protease RseP (regulator of RpoE activity)